MTGVGRCTAPTAVARSTPDRVTLRPGAAPSRSHPGRGRSSPGGRRPRGTPRAGRAAARPRCRRGPRGRRPAPGPPGLRRARPRGACARGRSRGARDGRRCSARAPRRSPATDTCSRRSVAGGLPPPRRPRGARTASPAPFRRSRATRAARRSGARSRARRGDPRAACPAAPSSRPVRRDGSTRLRPTLRLRQDHFQRLVAVAVAKADHGIAQRHAGGERRGKRRGGAGELPHPGVHDAPVHEERPVLELELVLVVGHLGRKVELLGERRRRERAGELDAHQVGVVAVDDPVDLAVAARALELLVEWLPPRVEAVEGDTALDPARSDERQDEPSDRDEHEPVERPAQRGRRERHAAEDVLAEPPARLGHAQHEAPEHPRPHGQREEPHAIRRKAHGERTDRIEDQVQDHVRRRGELGIEEAAVGHRGLEPLLLRGGKGAQHPLKRAQQHERQRPPAAPARRPQLGEQGLEVRRQLARERAHLPRRRLGCRDRLLDRRAHGGTRGRLRRRRGLGSRRGRRRRCGGGSGRRGGRGRRRRCPRPFPLDPRRCVVGNHLPRMQRPRPRQQHLVRLRPRRIRHAAVHRTHRRTRLVIVKPHALRALLRHDVEDVVRQRRVHRPVGRLPLHSPLVDGRVRTLRLAGAAVDALARDHRRHRPRAIALARARFKCTQPDDRGGRTGMTDGQPSRRTPAGGTAGPGRRPLRVLLVAPRATGRGRGGAGRRAPRRSRGEHGRDVPAGHRARRASRPTRALSAHRPLARRRGHRRRGPARRPRRPARPGARAPVRARALGPLDAPRPPDRRHLGRQGRARERPSLPPRRERRSPPRARRRGLSRAHAPPRLGRGHRRGRPPALAARPLPHQRAPDQLALRPAARAFGQRRRAAAEPAARRARRAAPRRARRRAERPRRPRARVRLPRPRPGSGRRGPHRGRAQDPRAAHRERAARARGGHSRRDAARRGSGSPRRAAGAGIGAAAHQDGAGRGARGRRAAALRARHRRRHDDHRAGRAPGRPRVRRGARAAARARGRGGIHLLPLRRRPGPAVARRDHHPPAPRGRAGDAARGDHGARHRLGAARRHARARRGGGGKVQPARRAGPRRGGAASRHRHRRRRAHAHDGAGLEVEARPQAIEEAPGGGVRRGPGFWPRLLRFLAVMGPGVITANVDNDAGGITTYSLAGARYGYALVWTLLPITVALVVVQEMCARMGAITGKGLADLIREHFGVRVTFYAMVLLLLANLGNTMAEFAGVAASLELFGVSRWVSVPLVAAFVWWLVVYGNYGKVEKVFLAACVFYLAYVGSGLLAVRSWATVAERSFDPRVPVNAAYLTMLVRSVGPTIAPWMQFYQQSAIVEKGVRAEDYPYSRLDVVGGCVFTDVVAFFIVVACAATLHAQGIPIDTAADAAQALRPLAGAYCAALFAFGLFNASVFSAAVLPLATAYSVCEAFGWETGVNKRLREAPHFYGLYTGLIVLGALVILIPGIPLLPVMYLSQVANGVLLPVVLVLILRLVNQRELMGDHVNSPALNAVAWITVVVMGVLSLWLAVATLAGGA